LGGEEIVREIIPIYVEDIQKHFAKLSQAVEKGDCEFVTYHAHALQGVGRNLCNERLAELAAQVERSAKENDIAGGTVLLNGLKTEIERVVTVVTQCDWIEKVGMG